VFKRYHGAVRSSILRQTLAATAACATLLLAACSDATTDGGSSTDAASRTVLLYKATRTVLDQLVTYPSDSASEVSSSIVRLEPGAETGFHRHDTPLYVYVLRGTVTVSYDGDVVKEYPAGSAFLEAIGTYHNGRNEGTEMVEILTVSIGAEGLENTVARP
jgi:quercetin dioxygenase-like cupin family protein